jgi:Tfp pilus assembly protein PilF
MRAMKILVLMVVATLLVGGCRRKNDPSRGNGGLSQREGDEKFETAQDPPIKAETHFAAGQLAESQDQLPRAVEQYKAALKVDPQHQAAMYKLGEVYTQLKMYPEAIEAWRSYIKATKGAAAGYSNLALTYEFARKLKEAEEAHRNAIEKDPADQRCRVNYGLMLARQGRIAEATRQFSAVLKPAEVHYNLGSVFQQQGKKEQARAEYQKALLLDAGLHDAKARLAELK